MAAVTRDFTVSTFVVHEQKVLLLWHRKLAMWLPPGGHIEPGELPDEAAVREVREEAGLEVVLTSPPGLPPVPGPRQLARPEGIQLEEIEPGHEHIDLIYFARPADPAAVRPVANDEVERVGWYGRPDLDRIPLTPEVRTWVERALAAAAERE
ncbi:8-oxo-dGTP pyrophosphatase MutT (NUDIX family) [Symbiobacterium terraclitae]|uniref:8-oxo-dGTP pyrophosphatase MutT (NUDIX family) n=1 Tax=Symbiobacterium terraclitae TaxID=557451 RepID=A0ABS4JPC5_9FIRM|nr:NUDIX hydrolase [Symbiobacterium terraclitae]MBP2017365.1 8-oxo-dGTP pyrophosphatase MutT (NUDIX family) [Symbiobacterium terraclitae]